MMDDQTTKQATARNLLVAPRKLRLVADAVKGRRIEEADQLLALLPQRGALYLRKAMLTASHNLALSRSSRIAAIEVNEGMKLKRFVLAPRGVARAYFKARSHVRFTFSEAMANGEGRRAKKKSTSELSKEEKSK